MRGAIDSRSKHSLCTIWGGCIIHTSTDLLWNNPCDTELVIALSGNGGESDGESDARWSDALQQNEHVKHITFQFHGVASNNNWDSFQRVIGERVNLEKVTLSDKWTNSDEWTNSDDAFGRRNGNNRLLQAVLWNESIHTLRLHNMTLSADILSSLVRSTTSILKLALCQCRVVFLQGGPDQPDQPDVLASAFQENSSITHLTLERMKQEFIVPILTGLKESKNSTMLSLELTFGGAPSVVTGEAIRDLLLSSNAPAFKYLRLNRGQFSGETFKALAQGIGQCTTATDICFDRCAFDDDESTLLFEKTFRESLKGTLQGLQLSVSGRITDGFSHPIATVLDNMLGPTSSLRHLHLSGSTFSNLVDGNAVTSVMEAVLGRSALDYLGVYNIDTTEKKKVRALAKSLWNARRLKTFCFNVTDSGYPSKEKREELIRKTKERFKRAFKRNTSLVNIAYTGRDGREDIFTDIFTEGDDTEIGNRMARSESLPLLIASPDSVPIAVWPRILGKVQQCSLRNDIVFETMMVLAEELTRFVLNENEKVIEYAATRKRRRDE